MTRNVGEKQNNNGQILGWYRIEVSHTDIEIIRQCRQHLYGKLDTRYQYLSMLCDRMEMGRKIDKIEIDMVMHTLKSRHEYLSQNTKYKNVWIREWNLIENTYSIKDARNIDSHYVTVKVQDESQVELDMIDCLINKIKSQDEYIRMLTYEYLFNSNT